MACRLYCTVLLCVAVTQHDKILLSNIKGLKGYEKAPEYMNGFMQQIVRHWKLILTMCEAILREGKKS